MENPHVFVDNTSPEIHYSGDCQEDTSVNSSNTFQGSQHVCRAGDEESFMEFRFTGKGAEIYGTLDSGLDLKSLMDNATYTPLSDGEGNPSGRKGVKIFDLGVLSGPHIINLEPRAGQLVIDYLIYTPVGKTEFNGKQLIYDDTNPSFNFSGAWSPRSRFDEAALPFNDTLTYTTTPGSSLVIDFVGSSIAVYGALNPTPGTLSATFSIDGSSPEPIQLNRSSETTTTSEWTLHTLFFRHTFPEADVSTPHSLNVTVVETSESQPFQLDYVLTTGNAHTRLTERPFEKVGDEKRAVGLKIGLIILGIAVVLFAWIVWSKWRERKKRPAKASGEPSKT